MISRHPFSLLAVFFFFLTGCTASPLPETGEKDKSFVRIERVVSPGGIEAWLVQDHTNPIIAVRFSFTGGASLDETGKEGLAEMVSSLLDEGAGELDSQSFQRRLEDLSVTLRFSASRDFFSGRLKTLTDNTGEAFDLLRLALAEPRFDPEPVERIRSQLLAVLRQNEEDPDTIAGRTLNRILFPDHTYGRPASGDSESIKSITREDLGKYASAYLARGNLKIGVVGDITPEQLQTYLDHTFGGLPDEPVPFSIPETTPRTTGETRIIEMDVPQSAIVFAQSGVKRDQPEFFTAYVLNHILGEGGFTSRLYNEIREKRGLAYAIGSYLYPLKRTALIYGSAGTANAGVKEALQVLRDEWHLMKDKGVTPEELKDAKTYLTGSYPLRFSSSGRIAAILVAMQTENLGIDYLDNRNSYIEAVTLEDVNALARKLLTPEDLTIVVVGKPDA